MTKPSKEDQFADLYSSSQQRLYGYVMGLVRNSTDAHDILQQTAITAWRKFDTFDPSTDFIRWTIVIARYETLNFIKSRRRNKLYFDQALMEQLGDAAISRSETIVEDRSRALAECLKSLSAQDNHLIECRYSYGLVSHQIAELLKRSQSSVCNSLRRIRENLLRCIESRVAQEAHDG